MGLIDLTADLTYNSNFETEPVQNQTGPEINSFSTSNLESSPTEEIGSVNFFTSNRQGEPLNIEGFSGNMTPLETLYPNTIELGSVDYFTLDKFNEPLNIEGFTQNMTPLETLYPNTIELGSVDFIPGGNFSNNFLTSTGFTQNAEPFGGNKLETEFLMVGGESSLNQEFMGNELFSSINTLGTYKGAVNFISDSDSYATGFTKNMQPIGGDKLDTQYDISTYYTDEELTFSGITQGIPSPGLSIYSAGLESQFTSIADSVNADVTWNLQIPAAGLAGTEPPYDRDQLIGSLESWTIETGIQYKGEVNFFSDTTSYATGFTQKMEFQGDSKKDSQYDIDTFYTDKGMNFTGVTSGIPNPSVTTYPTLGSIFTTDSDMLDPTGESVIGTQTEFSVYSLGDFQQGNVAGMGVRGVTPFNYLQLSSDGDTGMASWNVGGFNIKDFTTGIGNGISGLTQGSYPTGDSTFVFTTGGELKLGLSTTENIFSNPSYTANAIPSFNIPRPDNNVSSGPFSVNSGFQDGDFVLDTTAYLQSGGTSAVEGSIVRKIDNDDGTSSPLNDLRINGTTLSSLFNNGNYDNSDLTNIKGTKYRDIQNMDGMAGTIYTNGYGDGINSGWMENLIDKKVDVRDYAGHSSDFFVRESGGGRFVGRILKDLERTLKWQTSFEGLKSFGKNTVMTLFNSSERSLLNPVISQFATSAGGMFGIRTTSAFSNIVEAIATGTGFKSGGSLLFYENRVNQKHPSNEGFFGAAATAAGAALGISSNANVRTLTDRYGQPKYQVRGMSGLTRAKKAHQLYSKGFLDRKEGRGLDALDRINIKSYGDEYGNEKDLVKFNFVDLRNNKRIIFRAFITNIQDNITPEWNNYKFIGRPDDVYVYKGTSRSISFNLRVAAFSRWEMIPMWERINYLVGLTYGSYVNTNIESSEGYAQTNMGMSSPMVMMTIGDYVTDQPGYIKDFSISIPTEYPWDTIVDDGGSNQVGELPQVIDINLGYQVVPQQVPDSYGKHFGKVGVEEGELSRSGLPWLADMYRNSVSSLTKFDELHEKYAKKEDVKSDDGKSDEASEPANDAPDTNSFVDKIKTMLNGQ